LRDLAEEGLDKSEIVLEPALDMRYKGQSFEITVPFTENPLKEFHEAHQKLYGYSSPGKPVEAVNVRLRARGIPPKPRLTYIEEGGNTPPKGAQVATTRAVFQGVEEEVPVFSREKLLANNLLKGPALVVEYSATLVIPPFARGQVDHLGNIILEIEG
ncbi:MAG: hydantoinase/oxoprolinase family protein, partial [Aquificota bacterium]